MSENTHRGDTDESAVDVNVVRDDARVRLTDARLLVIFLLLMALLGGAGTYVKTQLDKNREFRTQASANCESNRVNTLGFNAFITRLQRVTLGSPVLTESQKRKRVAFYQAGKQGVPQCPPPPSGIIKEGKTDPPSPPPTKPLEGLN